MIKDDESPFATVPFDTLPAPKVPAARDGGLGYDDLKNRNGYTYVDVGPLLDAMGGETVSVSLNGAPVATHTVTSDDLAEDVIPVAVSNAKFVDAGDGIHTLTYTLVYEEGEGEDLSAPTDVLVKRSVPGGLDPSPGTPEYNENLKVAFVEPSPVPADAVSVSIDVELWINAAVGDVMTVSWNGALFDSSPLETPFPTRFGLSLTAAQVLDAGVGSAIPVTWGVIDVAGNWSGWAKETVVDVRIEDPGLLSAPHVGDKDQPWTEIDLATLGSADLMVFTPEYAGAVKGDSVIVHTYGTSVGGDAVTFDTVPQTMMGDGFGLTFNVPNATVQALAASNLRVWYSVSGKGDSKSVWLPVRGVAQGGLPVPAVTEAVDTNGDGLADQLDPDQANPSGRVVIDYPGMARFDTVTLVLDGTAGSGAPVQVTFERQISDVAPLTVVVIHADLLKFLDGQMDVYYRVEPFGKRRHPALIRALLPPESAHLALRVRRGSAEQPLPAPTVDELVGGLLDPAAEQATLRAPLYPGIAKGDEITYTWAGTVSTRKWTYKVAEPTRTPADYADRDFIEANTGGKVAVSYGVRRLGADPVVSSEVLEFDISVAQANGRAYEVETFDGVPYSPAASLRLRFATLQVTDGVISRFKPQPSSAPYLSGPIAGSISGTRFGGGALGTIIFDTPVEKIRLGVYATSSYSTRTNIVAFDIDDKELSRGSTNGSYGEWIVLQADGPRRIARLDIIVPAYSTANIDNLMVSTGDAWGIRTPPLTEAFDNLPLGSYGDHHSFDDWAVSTGGAHIAVEQAIGGMTGRVLAVYVSPDVVAHELTPRYGMCPRKRVSLSMRSNLVSGRDITVSLYYLNRDDASLRVVSRNIILSNATQRVTFDGAEEVATDFEFVSHISVATPDDSAFTAVFYDEITLE